MTAESKSPEPKQTVRKAAPKSPPKPRAAKAGGKATTPRAKRTVPKPAEATPAEAKPAATEISLPDITARLLAIAALGEASGAGPMLSLARAALMDAARLNGLAGESRAPGASIEDLLERLDAEHDKGAAKPGDAAATED